MQNEYEPNFRFSLSSVIKHFREIEGYTTIDVGKQKIVLR